MISPATPVSSSPTTRTAAPKRRLGPRPLQLVEGTTSSVSLSSTPITSPASDDGQDPEFASALSPTGSRVGSTRRQSSISYKPLDSSDDRRGTPTRQAGAMPSPGTTGAHAGSVHGPNGLERPPLTLAERCVYGHSTTVFGVTLSADTRNCCSSSRRRSPSVWSCGHSWRCTRPSCCCVGGLSLVGRSDPSLTRCSEAQVGADREPAVRRTGGRRVRAGGDPGGRTGRGSVAGELDRGAGIGSERGRDRGHGCDPDRASLFKDYVIVGIRGLSHSLPYIKHNHTSVTAQCPFPTIQLVLHQAGHLPLLAQHPPCHPV